MREPFSPLAWFTAVPMLSWQRALAVLLGLMLLILAMSKCLGQEVGATHLRPVSSGLVTGTAKPIHLGRRSQVWEIRLEDDRGKLTCISKLTLAILPL